MKYPNIEAERARNGMTASALAERLGVTRTVYKNWQNDKTEIPASKIIEITKIFGVSADYLLETRS